VKNLSLKCSILAICVIYARVMDMFFKKIQDLPGVKNFKLAFGLSPNF